MRNGSRLRFHMVPVPEWPQERTSAPDAMVLDACTLLLLAEPIPEKYFREDVPPESRPSTYFDLLKLLYPSVISKFYVPDIVVFEATGYAPSGDQHKGRNICELLNGGMQADNPEWLSVLKRMIGIGSKPEFPGMEIVHSDIGQKYIHDIRPFYRAIEHTAEILGDRYLGRAERILYEKQSAKQKQALHKQRHEKGGDNLGEIAGVEYALGYATQHKAHVVFCSEDQDAHAMLTQNLIRNVHAKSMDVSALNLRGLLGMLQSRGLLYQAGLKPDANIADLAQAADINHNPDHHGHNAAQRVNGAAHRNASFSHFMRQARDNGRDELSL